MEEDFKDIIDYYMEQEEFNDEFDETEKDYYMEQEEFNDEFDETEKEDFTDVETDRSSGDDNESNGDSSESDSNESSLKRKEKRGRPIGWRKITSESCESRPTKRAKKQMSPNEIPTFFCCLKMCAVALSVTTVEMARQSFQAMKKMDRSEYILNWIRDHSSIENMKLSTTFNIGSQNVCLNAFLSVLAFPRSTYYEIKKMFLAGKPYTSPGRLKGIKGASANFFIMWMNNFSVKHAEKIPNSAKFHLPCCLTKYSVWELMCTDAQKETIEPPSYSHSMKIWRSQLNHIKIPKRTRFSKCDTCIQLKERIAATNEKSVREQLQWQRSIHLEQQNKERQKYYKHISKAKNNPNNYLSIIMDAMDQDKTAIPRLCETPKSLGNIWRLKVNLMGAIVHGIGVYGFFDAFQWAHGASYTLSVLVHILSMLDFLPDVLYLQLDNCPGQNKNRYVLGFVAKLVEANIFKKVKVSFLMVGHTHEDIDQLFSRFSVRASREDIFILDDLITTFEKCYKQLPVTGMKIAEVYDFQEWLQLNNIKNHSHPHVFKFTKNEDGKATMKYKKWSTDKKWITSTGSDKYLLQDMDDSPINKIKPNVDNLDFERLRHDTDQVARFYNKEKIASWWDSFLSELEEEDDDELPPLSLIQNLREKKCAIVQEEPVEHLTPGPADEPIPQVVIGKKTHIIDEEIKEGDLVLTDTPLSPEDWPQVARVVEILPENRLKLQPYWGKKTTTWTPAYRKNKGPIYITVNKNVIWHHGFNLTQSGYLPKNIKELVGKYEEDNL